MMIFLTPYLARVLPLPGNCFSVSRLCKFPRPDNYSPIGASTYLPPFLTSSSIMAREFPASSCDGFAFPSAFHGASSTLSDHNFLRPSANVNGIPAIFLSSDDIEALASPLELCLVENFGDEVPPIVTLRVWLRSQGCSTVTRISRWTDHCAVFFFQSRAEYAMAFTATFINLGATLMRLTKWAHSVPAELDSPIAPVWIQFPDLPLRFFNKELLFSMGAIFGRPLQLHIDTFNLTRIDIARILVEMDVTAPFPTVILLGSIEDGHKQAVEIPHIPPYCLTCCTFGHRQPSCPGFNRSPSGLAESSSVNFNVGEALFFRPETSDTRFQQRRRFRARRPPRYGNIAAAAHQLPNDPSTSAEPSHT